jgi:hypothetical protein
MKITEKLLRKVVTETLKKTGYVTEAFRMEKDFKKGMAVSWNTLITKEFLMRGILWI